MSSSTEVFNILDPLIINNYLPTRLSSLRSATFPQESVVTAPHGTKHRPDTPSTLTAQLNEQMVRIKSKMKQEKHRVTHRPYLWKFEQPYLWDRMSLLVRGTGYGLSHSLVLKRNTFMPSILTHLKKNVLSPDKITLKKDTKRQVWKQKVNTYKVLCKKKCILMYKYVR